MMPFEHAEDTGRNHVRAMIDGVPGEEYIIANEPRTMVKVFDFAEDIIGIPALRAVPPAVFGGLAKVMAVTERVVTPPEDLASELLAFHAGRNYAVDNTKAKRELGIEHRPLEDGLREYLDWKWTTSGWTYRKNGQSYNKYWQDVLIRYLPPLYLAILPGLFQ